MKYLILLSILLLITACTQDRVLITNDHGDGVIVNIEIALTSEEKATGLMNRKHLPYNQGMLFIYKEEGVYPFWMKNTLIPLDIIYIDKNLKIVDIIEAEPCYTSECPNYKPKQQAKYVLEVNKGFSKASKISINNSLKFFIND